jgi:hypothetical protein
MRTAAILSIAVLAVVTLVFSPPAAAPSWAHDGLASVFDLAPARRLGEVPLLALLVAVVLRGLCRRRRLALALAVAFPVLGFEVGLHSVHHLDDSGHASQCAIASATTHLNGTPVDTPRSVSPVEWTTQLAPIFPDVATPHRSLAPHEGRAPPIVLA